MRRFMVTWALPAALIASSSSQLMHHRMRPLEFVYDALLLAFFAVVVVRLGQRGLLRQGPAALRQSIDARGHITTPFEFVAILIAVGCGVFGSLVN